MSRLFRLTLLPVAFGLALTACGAAQDDPACVNERQCPLGFTCRDGLCSVACAEDNQCRPGETCQSGACLPGFPDVGGEPEMGDVGADALEEPDAIEVPLGIGPDGQPIFGAPVGADCELAEDCRSGLSCVDEACRPDGEAEPGDLCAVSGECAQGLSCGSDARCVETADLGEGAACSPITSADCGAGLRCLAFGLGGLCSLEGDGDIGAVCAADTDCLSPLACAADGACTLPIFGGVVLYPGADCAAEGDGDYRVYFEVPVPGEPLSEFYRLPYPNDIRRTPTGLDLAGHPAPDRGVLGAAVVAGVLDALATDSGGFSPAPSIIFRFSEDYDFGTITILGDEATLRYVNIHDPEASRYGRGPTSINWTLNNGRSRWLCENSIAIRGSWHQPLAHGETYAVYLTTGVTSTNGETPVQDDEFAAMLAEAEPDEADLASAWEAYAPFRDYLQREEIDPETIAAAAVFTTMDPDAVVPALREAIRDRPVTPSLDELVLCDEGVTSPCDDGESRICLNADTGYLELHATYRAPVYQAGDRPYLRPSDGGGLELDEDLSPVAQGVEEICAGLTIPAVDMPEAGWPVVLFAHGTNGDFLSHLRNGVADNLTGVDLGDGDVVSFATIGIDGVQHGPRRGDSSLDPQALFFNIENPSASVGNVLQGAADYFFLTHLLEQIDIDAESSPTGDAIRFDTENIYFFGHSQGATVGTPFVAYEPGVRAAVFSGAGAGLVLSLLNKESPTSVAGAVSMVLNEERLRDTHPLLALVQQVSDRADPIHYGSLLLEEPPAGRAPTHLFVSYGLGDTFTPDPTIEVFGSQSGVELAQPAEWEVVVVPDVDYPVSGNRRAESEDVTAVLVTYTPAEGEDGHFVAFRESAARRQIAEFLATAVRDGVPSVTAAQ